MPAFPFLATAAFRRASSRVDPHAITASEKARLEQLVGEAEELMVANARLVARFAEAEGENSAAAAVPVTVWVKPEHAGR